MTSACEDEVSGSLLVDVGKITAEVVAFVDPADTDLDRSFREVELVSKELVRGNLVPNAGAEGETVGSKVDTADVSWLDIEGSPEVSEKKGEVKDVFKLGNGDDGLIL